jgi:hypothetical protein
MTECSFCAVLAGTERGWRVYEDEAAGIWFRDTATTRSALVEEASND